MAAHLKLIAPSAVKRTVGRKAECGAPHPRASDQR